ncbi:MAG: hypothetical protein A3F42_07395 [Gammaproteobacteria bacterium RIFCSPHIGHO2_12_FULL_37_34]|nr:MAG: hypothetical protein A3F42_07395 [Gammaproteobacteria bacterium RIFCSPHIGHO2_12_FULL_37_34]
MSFLKEKTYLKYYSLFAILLITAQLAANVLGPRTIVLGPFLLPGGIWSFPLTFFLWDIVTEVYGFQRARQLILYYLIGEIFFAVLIDFGLRMQAASTVQHPQYYADVLGSVFRLSMSMVIAVILGDYVNCYVLDRLKTYTQGKYLWMRLIGSTALGELVTSLIWVVSFYFGKAHHPDVLRLIFSQYIIKVLFEVAFVPATYIIINFLKNNEVMDSNKRYTNFDPYTLERFANTGSRD